jgi:hypothetical protein
MYLKILLTLPGKSNSRERKIYDIGTQITTYEIFRFTGVQ